MSWRKQLLVESLGCLAAEARLQLEYLQRLGEQVNVDELALEFDDVAAAADDMRISGEISESQYKCIVDLDRELDQMSGGHSSSLWTPKALETADEWERIRTLAKRCLNQFETSGSGLGSNQTGP